MTTTIAAMLLPGDILLPGREEVIRTHEVDGHINVLVLSPTARKKVSKIATAARLAGVRITINHWSELWQVDANHVFEVDAEADADG